MTVTNEQVRAAKKQRQFHSARDFETSASQIGDVEPIGAELKTAVQRIIAANAKGRSKKAQIADAELLMRMLGVHPEDDFDPTENIAALTPHPTSRR